MDLSTWWRMPRPTWLESCIVRRTQLQAVLVHTDRWSLSIYIYYDCLSCLIVMYILQTMSRLFVLKLLRLLDHSVTACVGRLLRTTIGISTETLLSTGSIEGFFACLYFRASNCEHPHHCSILIQYRYNKSYANNSDGLLMFESQISCHGHTSHNRRASS